MRRFVLLLLLAAGCHRDRDLAAQAAGGDPSRGKEAIGRHGCGSCHTIPGVAGANANVGPSLAGIGKRAYVAGEPNSVENLTKWVKHPQKVEPGTPMPETGVDDATAKDIAAYLYTLR